MRLEINCKKKIKEYKHVAAKHYANKKNLWVTEEIKEEI